MTDNARNAEPSSVASPDSPPPSKREPRKRTWLPWVVGGVIVVVFVGLLAGVVIWALSRTPVGSIDPALTRSAFESAMRKANVTATYPAAPVELTTLRVSGSHPFSATFTGDELAALLNTYPYTADIAGSQISIANVRLRLDARDSLRLTVAATVDGSAYSGSITASAAFSNGSVTSSGATAASVEGLPLNAGQRAQITGALVGYVNAYLSAAPGLTMSSAKVTADGIAVTGIAPDRIELP